MRLNIGTTVHPIGRVKGWRYSKPAVEVTVDDVIAYHRLDLLPVLVKKIEKAIENAKKVWKETDAELYSGRCPRGSYHGNKVSAKWYYWERKIDTLQEQLKRLETFRGDDLSKVIDKGDKI